MAIRSLKLTQDANLSDVRITNDGYLAAEVRCARSGIQEYAGFEFGKDQAIVRVYRPEDEVFQKASLHTYAGKPLTNDHPPEPVNAGNWSQYSIGSIGNEVLRDKEWIVVPITLMDGKAVKAVENGKRQLSVGYSVEIDDTAGVTDSGEPYDAVMRNIEVNHLALVDAARAGPSARIGDSWAEPKPAKTPKVKPKEATTVDLKKITVDGLSVETTDAGVEAINKLQGDIKELKKSAKDSASAAKDAAAEAKVAHDAAIAEKDKELAAKDTQIAELKKAQLSDADLDARVQVRSELVAKASALVKDADFTGKSDLEIKTAAINAVHGANFLDGKSEAYIDAAFDLLAVDKSKDLRDAVAGQPPGAPMMFGAISDSQRAYEERLRGGKAAA